MMYLWQIDVETVYEYNNQTTRRHNTADSLRSARILLAARTQDILNLFWGQRERYRRHTHSHAHTPMHTLSHRDANAARIEK